jgi:hypothetical protein
MAELAARVNLIDVPGQLEDHAGVLGVALATWATRDDSKAQPEVRQAANTAMDAIDAMLAELHRARASLVTEIRQANDASAARVGALLAERRLRASALAQQMTRGDRRDRRPACPLVLQPDFVIFMVAWLAAGSGRFWRGADCVAARWTIAAGAGYLARAG